MSERNRATHGTPRRRRRALVSAAAPIACALAVVAMTSGGAQARSQVAPASTSPPVISGSPVAGETLTTSSGSWSGTAPITFEYAWQRCDAAGASCVAISTATGQTYVVAGADVGSTLRALVTALNADGTAAALSEPTAVVTEPVAPSATAEPVIAGSALEGATLTTSNGSWSGTAPIVFAYQWVRCGADGGLPDGSNCSSISGATTSSYALTSADIGQRLRARVTGSNAAGASTVASNATTVVEQSTTTGPPRNLQEPTISGTLTRGRSLSAARGTWVGATPLSYAYQWVRCGADGGLPDGSDCTFVASATATSYLLTSDDVGRRIRVRITASNGAGVQTVASNATDAIQATQTTPTVPAVPAQAPTNTSKPSVSGAAIQEQTLTASVGTWTGTAPLAFAYRWLRCGADGGQPTGSDCTTIAGETGTQYVPTASDVGQRLRVQVTARNARGSSTATSDPTAQVRTGAETPSRPGTLLPPTTSLPVGAIRLRDGNVSIPVAAVSLPERLVLDQVVFTPNPVRSRGGTLVMRVHVVDTRGYAVRGALVFGRSTPLVTSPAGEQRTGTDGWALLRMTTRAGFPLGDGQNVQFWVRARKQGEALLAGVSNRRLVQVATAG